MKKLDTSTGRITVDGVEYSWRVRHTWVLQHGVGVKGISISVWLQPEKTRELILDFPFATFNMHRPPSHVALADAVKVAVTAAIAAGWDPESRGRPFRFDVPGATEHT
jgi:hypothetical protein